MGTTSRQYQSAPRYYLARTSPNHSMTFCRPKQARKLKNTKSFKYIDNFLSKTKPQNQRAQRVSHDQREYKARRQPSIPRAQRVSSSKPRLLSIQKRPRSLFKISCAKGFPKFLNLTLHAVFALCKIRIHTVDNHANRTRTFTTNLA